MPAIWRSEDAVGATPTTTDDSVITVLSDYTNRVCGTLPTTIEDCFDIINALVQDEGRSIAVNLLTLQLQKVRRNVAESVAELAHIENGKEEALREALQGASQEIGA